MFTQQSMQFDGQYFEDIIEGYTTISVSGRESLDVSVESKTVGNRDGSIYKSKRYESRTLSVSFVIEGIERADLMLKLNTLNGILNTSNEVIVIVDDEPDVFYRGTRAASADYSITLAPGTGNAVASGTFEIFCADGFKYSVEEFEVDGEVLDDNNGVMFAVNYSGTQKAYPRFETLFYSKIPEITESNMDDESIVGTENESLDNAGECSFVSFYNDKEKILQFGDPDIINTSESSNPKSQTLITQMFKTINSWGTEAKRNWTLNNGLNLNSNKYIQQGSLDIGYPMYNTDSVSTSGSVLSKVKTSSSLSPSISYIVNYKADTRREDSVKLTLTIKSVVAAGASYNIPKGVVLYAIIEIDGTQYNRKIKSKDVVWSSGKTYTSNWSFTVSNLGDPERQDLSARFKIATSFSGIKAFSSKTSYKKGAIVSYNGNYYRANTSISKGSWKSSKWNNINNLAYLTARNTKVITIPTYMEATYNSYYLTPYTYGADQVNKRVGPTMSRIVPEDASGDIGALDFTFTWRMKMSIGKDTNDTNHRGVFQALLITGDEIGGSISNKKVLSGIEIAKSDAGSKGIIIQYYLDSETGNLKSIKKEGVDLSYNNPYLGTPKNTDATSLESVVESVREALSSLKSGNNQRNACSIKRKGNSISFDIGGLVLDNIQVPLNSKVYQIQFGFFKESGYPIMDLFGIYDCKFVKGDCETDITVENPFSAAGVLRADCSNAEILLDDNRRPDLGALGNDWEDLYLEPGNNNIGASYELINPELTSVLRQCYDTEPFGGDFYTPNEGLTEEEFNADKTSYWVYSGGTYIQCTDDSEFNESLTYYTFSEGDVIYRNSDGTIVNPQPTKDEFSDNESLYYVEESCAPSFKMYYREVFV